MEIVEVHIGAAVIDPWDRTAIAKGLAHRSGHARLFLGNADKDHSLLMLLFESAQPCLHNMVLALALFKPDQIDFVIEPKLHDRFHKGLGHLRDLLGGGKAVSQIPAHKACNPRLAGQLGHVSIQIHPVNALLAFYENSLRKFLDFLGPKADAPMSEVTKADIVAVPKSALNPGIRKDR